MAVSTSSVNGLAQGTGRDTFWNNFPRGERYINISGPSANTVSVQELKKYEIDIDDNIRSMQPMKFPFKHIIEGLSKGATINATEITWTDEYLSGDGVMTLPLDDLRCRDYDQAETFVASTMGIGAVAERGGKMMWQKCGFSLESETTEDEVIHADMCKLNTAYVTATDAGVYHIGSKNPIVGTSSLISGIDGELKETAPFPMTYDGISYNCLAYGYSRSSDYIVGKTDGILHMLAAILENREYARTTSTSILWKDEGTITVGATVPTISYAFKTGQSKKVHLYFDQLYTVGTVGEVCTFASKMQVIVGIQQIIFANDLSKFILILDMDSNNIDISNSLTLYKDGNTAVPGDIWVMCTKGTFTVNSVARTIGDIFRTTTSSGLTASAANQCVTVPFAVLVEEVNTSTDKAGAFISKATGDEAPIFSNSTATSATQGWSRMGSRVLMNLHQDVPVAVGSAQEFDLTSLKGGYFYDNMRTKTNNVQIFQSKPWGAERMRQNTNIAFGDPMNLDRMIHIAEFDKGKNNAMLFGRKRRTQMTTAGANYSYEISNPAGSYKGTMAGIFSYEDFPLMYVKKPFTLSNTASLLAGGADAAYGYAFYQFMEEFADAVSFNIQPGQYTGTSCFMSRTVMQTLRMNQYRTQSAISANGNILGHVVYNPKSEANMFIDNYEYTSSRGHTIRFIYDPSLDFALPFPAPRFLLGRTGKQSQINPRWCIIAIDKNHIRTFSHAAFPDKIYGNLQPNNNVNISIEGMQGSATLELRFPEAHLIMDISNT